MDNKINLFLNDGIAFVWNTDDWFALRSKHRICGQLLGTLPSHPRQNIFSGLPATLLPEEAALLVEENICKLFKYEGFKNLPSEDIQKMVVETEARLYEEQSHFMRIQRVKQITEKMDVIIAGKQKKMKERGENATDKTLDHKALLEEETNNLQPLSKVHTLVQIPTSHPWPQEKTAVSLQELKPNPLGTIKYEVFKDLWSRGYHITSGSKFGGDFLVYPGDPVKFHAMYIVRCMSTTTKLSLPQIVAYGRLGVSVNKLSVLATQNQDKQVEYQTLQWHETLQ